MVDFCKHMTHTHMISYISGIEILHINVKEYSVFRLRFVESQVNFRTKILEKFN